MRQLSTRDQMTQKLTAIGHRTVFTIHKISHRKVSYKRPRNHKCKKNLLKNTYKPYKQRRGTCGI